MVVRATYQTIPRHPHSGSPPRPIDIHLFVDASESWGIGLWWNGKWLAWELKPGWNEDGQRIGCLRMTAVLLAVLTLITAGNFANTPVIIHSDNIGVIRALKPDNWKSRGQHQNEILRHIVRHIIEDKIWISLKYVNTKLNPADGPSRGKFLPKTQLYAKPLRVPSYLKPLIHNAVQYHDHRVPTE